MANNGAMKGVGGGCLGCGCLLTLVGLAAIGAAIGGAVNYSEVSTAYSVGGSNLCCGLSGMLLGGILLFMGIRGAKAEAG